MEDEALEPEAILDQRLIKHGPTVDTFVLVKWKNRLKNDATWEFYSDLALRFRDIPLGSKDFQVGIDVASVLGFVEKFKEQDRDLINCKSSVFKQAVEHVVV